MPFSTYLGNVIIDHNLRSGAWTPPASLYVSLHSADPGLTGQNEISGSSYGRQILWLGAASNKTSSSGSTISYTGMPACTVTYAGVWDASGAGSGSFLMSGSLTGSKVVNQGDTFQFAVGNLTVNIT